MESLSGMDEWVFLDNDTLRKVARELFIKLDMVRAYEQDYEEAIKVLREVYNRGRSRGTMERSEGQ